MLLTPERKRDLLGLALAALALFLGLSLIPVDFVGLGAVFPDDNIMGRLGAWVGDTAFALLGVPAVVLPLLIAIAAAAAFADSARGRFTRLAVLLSGLALLACAALWLVTASGSDRPDRFSGVVGRGLGYPLAEVLGPFGAALALVFFGAALSVVTLGWNPVRSLARSLRPRRAVAAHGRAVDAGAEAAAGIAVAERAPEAEPAAEPLTAKLRRRLRARPSGPELEDVGDLGATNLPPLDLLAQQQAADASLGEKELDRLGRVLIDTLRTFRVEGELAGRTTGPVVTQFEVVPAPGVKVNRIAALDADLALALKAPSVRIVAPIPGKGAVGVEVPNPEAQTVRLREILESQAFRGHRGQLPLALGKDLTGKPYVADLARMPHLLIAGATGSGKSVCINTIITSLVYRYTPEQLRLLMIDPKMVELSMYTNLPHLRHPVVTDPSDAAMVLKWAVYEMDRRYNLLHENAARSIAEFNRRLRDGQEMRRAFPSGAEHDQDRMRYQDGPLPYIVLIVDELADLILTVQADVERPLAQLAQKARAIGIHLIVATQRPSVNVITGLIKANFPCRIAFRVSSKVDSRTILDQNGADALLGNGDLLFLPPGTSDPVRIQGAFLATEETEQLMEWYRERGRIARAEEDILEVVRSREVEEESDGFGTLPAERDTLFRQAAEVCVQFQQGSTSLLQRRLRIGYGRAARIIDQLHQAGILGPPDGSKPREVLVGLDALEHIAD